MTPDNPDYDVFRLMQTVTDAAGLPFGPVELETLHQPLLNAMDADELAAIKRGVSDLARALDYAGDERAATYVRATLWITLHNRQADLDQLTDAARVAIDANGHEVDLNYDTVQHERDGAGWSWYCTCETASGYLATRDEALAGGREHVAEHDGRWGLLDPPDAP